MFSKLTNKIDKSTGGDGKVYFKFRDFFTNTFKKHSFEQAEKVFECGTDKSTPDIKDVAIMWPKPWVFSRVFLALLVCVFLTYGLCKNFEMSVLEPGLMFLGAMIGPIPVLVFIFECNIPRNISLIAVLYIFFVGGILSLLATAVLSIFMPGGVDALIPSMITGLVEEIAKVVATYYFMKKFLNKKYILNGLLIGAAVGAGFAVFETAGYMYHSFFEINEGFFSTDIVKNFDSLLNVLILRGILAFGGHVTWAAIEGAAIAIAVKKFDGNLSFDVLKDKAFYSFFIICVVLHGVWDSFIPDIIPFFGIIALCVIAWLVIVVILNRGLKEIRAITSNAVNSTNEENKDIKVDNTKINEDLDKENKKESQDKEDSPKSDDSSN